jgi:hypothetical protein
MCPSGETCIVVSVSERYKNPTEHVDIVQSSHHHNLKFDKLNENFC